MPSGIFLRHVLREVLLATLLVAGVLLAVLAAYQFAFVLGRAADGQIPADAVPRLAMLSLRGNLPVILPPAVLLGTVMGLGRLYHDSEIAAAQACGVGNAVLIAAAGTVTAAAALLAGWAVFLDGPAAAREIVRLRLEALRTASTRGLIPGQFRPLGTDATLYFRARDTDGTLRDVFVQRDLPSAGGSRPIQVVLAAEARLAVAPGNEAWLVEFGRGRNYEGVPGAGDWRITGFARQQLAIPIPPGVLPGKPRVDVLGNRELLFAQDPRALGELHWRIGWVLAVLVLGMLAVPLARLAPWQGRHARLPWALLLFALYGSLLVAGRSMLERGELPRPLGLWWVPLSVILVALPAIRRRGAVRPAADPPRAASSPAGWS